VPVPVGALAEFGPYEVQVSGPSRVYRTDSVRRVAGLGFDLDDLAQATGRWAVPA
jgi:hypothetical protein